MSPKRFYLWLSKPVLLHWILPYLMALVLVGTVAQKYIGLYKSQTMFFSSFMFWAGYVPLPGGWTVCALLLASLSAKLIAASPWHKRTAGIFIAHLGVMLLLLGGLVTAVSSLEGYIALAKDESATSFSDYHLRELTIRKDGRLIEALPLEQLAKGQTVPASGLPFVLSVVNLCRNCTMAMRPGDTTAFRDSAQKVMLSPLAGELDDERNYSGLEFTVSGASPEANGTYLTFEPMEKHPGFILDGAHYQISLGRKSYPLPFTLQLLDAHKELHPGTDMARSYRSTVLLTDGAIQQRAVITMNNPLRYKGYTVYQASFNDEADSDTKSVSFAVVRNSGRVFPYVASITLCIGLLLHLAMRLPALLKKKAAHAV